MSAKEFAAFIHEYCKTGAIVNGGDVYGKLTELQQEIVNEIKKLIRKLK
jgi:hypothetical protein